MVSIKVLDKPDFKKIRMNCDGVIDEKLLKYPMIKEAFSTSSFNVIIGRPGQGKTSLMTYFVKNIFKKCFESIYVFMPFNSRASIENDIYGKHLPEEQLFDSLTAENLENVYQQLQENSSEGYHSLLCIDDYQAQLKQPDIIFVLNKIITKMRHLRCSIFLLQQNWQALVKPLRELVSNVIFFYLGKSQLTKLFDEVIPMDKDKYQQLVDLCFKDPHDWILINLHKSRNIYRNFDLIEYE
jgi:replicative DNA helicase